MKNITFSANDNLIAQARELAQARGVTLNDAFRDWLSSYVQQQGQDEKAARVRRLIDQITTPPGESSNVPVQAAYTPAHLQAPVREAFSAREQRILRRLGD